LLFDMGAGWGLSSEFAAYLGLNVVAVDINASFVRLMSERVKRHGLPIQAVQSTFEDFTWAKPADLVLFYECLHHAVRPWTVISRLCGMLRPGGRVLLAGEPINDFWWRHWGLRLDACSVYCIRKFGWFESGWSEPFLLQLLHRCSLTATIHQGASALIGAAVVAVKPTVHEVPGDVCATLFDVTGAITDSRFMIIGGSGDMVITFPARAATAIIKTGNYAGRPLASTFRIGRETLFSGEIVPGQTAITVPRRSDRVTLSFLVEQWSPAVELRTGDTRLLGLHVSSIVFSEEVFPAPAPAPPPPAETLLPQAGSAFLHYNASIDVPGTILRHAVPGLQPSAGYVTNYLGCLIDPKFYPHILSNMAGSVEGPPIPANWHADMAEWAAALRAVELSSDTFTVIELGCGWGCWLVNTGTAARHLGRTVRLIGVEADHDHVAFAQEACALNGFEPSQLELHRGVASFRSGEALFPRQAQGGESWGLQARYFTTAEEREALMATGLYDPLTLVPLADLVQATGRVDLLHVDIQGDEADLIETTVATLTERVAYIVIGTHSRQIEGRLMDVLLRHGWQIEVERPCISRIESGRPQTTVDGVQGWRNPALTAGA
jgi:FkbM family methyltransferase